MRIIKKIAIVLMIIMTITYCMPDVSMSIDSSYVISNKITINRPASVSTPEKDVPGLEKETAVKKEGIEWLWAIAVIAAIAGIASAAGSDGGNGGGSNGGTGSIDISW